MQTTTQTTTQTIDYRDELRSYVDYCKSELMPRLERDFEAGDIECLYELDQLGQQLVNYEAELAELDASLATVTTEPTQATTAVHATIIADHKEALRQVMQVRKRALASVRTAMQGVLNKLPCSTRNALQQLYLPERIQVELPNGATLVKAFPHQNALARVTGCPEFKCLALADLKTLTHFPIHSAALSSLLHASIHRKIA